MKPKMNKKWMSFAAAAVLLCSVLGCSGDAGGKAEDHLDSAVEERYPGGPAFLTSRDGISGSAAFTPDGVHQKLAIVATCFADERDDMAEIRAMQGSDLLTTIEMRCTEDEGYGSLVPDLYDDDGEEVLLEITEEDADDLAFRVVGYND